MKINAKLVRNRLLKHSDCSLRGGNSARQAAMFFSRTADYVHLIVRGALLAAERLY